MLILTNCVGKNRAGGKGRGIGAAECPGHLVKLLLGSFNRAVTGNNGVVGVFVNDFNGIFHRVIRDRGRQYYRGERVKEKMRFRSFIFRCAARPGETQSLTPTL